MIAQAVALSLMAITALVIIAFGAFTFIPFDDEEETNK